MDYLNTYDVVEMVVDEATSQFGGSWVVSETKKNQLAESCNIIDSLVEEFDCESTEASVDDDTMQLKVSIICPDMVLEYGRQHPFFLLIKQASGFRFSSIGDSLKVEFIFSGLWEHDK